MEFNTQLILALIFGFGTVVQGFLMVRDTGKWGGFFLAMGLCLLALLPGKHEQDYKRYSHLLLCFVVFSILVAIFYRRKILPCLNEKIILSYTITFWLAFFLYFKQDTSVRKVLTYIFMLPTAATLFIAFMKVRLNFFWKLFFYSWFLFVLVFVGVFQFPGVYMELFLSTKPQIHLPVWSSLLAGMAFFYIVAYAAYIFALIPIPGEHQTMEDRMREWHELTDLMTRRYEDVDSPYRETFLLLLLQCGFIVLNLKFHVLPETLAVNILLLVVMLPGISAGNAAGAIALKRGQGDLSTKN